MPQAPDNRLLLNRQALLELRQAGLKNTAENPINLTAARKIALWRQSDGIDLYLFSLLITAFRALSQRYFIHLELEPDLSSINCAGTKQDMPELQTAFLATSTCYPRKDVESATAPGMLATNIKSRQQLLADLFILEALTENPAAQSFRDLFNDTELISLINYRALIKKLTQLTAPLKKNAPGQRILSELLREPAMRAPQSLAQQVSFIAESWSAWLPDNVIAEIQLAEAVKAEENRPRLPGPGPSHLPLFGTGDGSNLPAAFSADTDWMATSVLLAKSIYVWLDQLSNRYQREIVLLSDIPDEELSRLAGWGFNALWLIGIWERSKASKKIKQLCGNPEAEASAYALRTYHVDSSLGGEQALQELKQRCQNHGIRLACDVVPNHMGIDSELVEQHPEWFLQTDQPPYPAYQFSGPDLCEDENVSIRIEDGYWDHSDAAVVYEHHDHRSNQRRYIYHGNDGTHMPWNDTAQLNFLLPEVRQAMSDLIVKIAQRFSLIRFDAAMTLARKHFRRLWFPSPGGSAGVPSRSVFAMTDADFTKAFPIEFWREVVDRINREAPDTLLIAEAFWLMESYFVRNLGMHRVYNSAFMNMLKREDNAKYRKIIKETLAYNPEILKRYVNFMNNPDEAPAVEQFDKGDKYFGVATLLATLPGLPMFGHGQVEGFREKYGMEYRRAYWQESPDEGFISHHEQQIFPLLRSRDLFADVKNFSLYDFSTESGINENVYAYSNGPSEQKVLVVFNNAEQPTSGQVHHAAPQSKQEEGTAQPMQPLDRELELNRGQGAFCRYRDLRGNEYLVPTDQLTAGLSLRLAGYEHRVFTDFKTFEDREGYWHKLHQQLQGSASTNLDRDFLQRRYQPLWESFDKLFDLDRLHVLAGGLMAPQQPQPIKALISNIDREITAFAELLAHYTDSVKIEPSVPENLAGLLTTVLTQMVALTSKGHPETLLSNHWQGSNKKKPSATSVLCWIILQKLAERTGSPNETLFFETLRRYGLDFAWQERATTEEQSKEVFIVSLLAQTVTMSPHPATDESAFTQLCQASENQNFLGINIHAGQSWFSREGMASLVGGLALQAWIMTLRDKPSTEKTSEIAEIMRQRLARAAAVGYRLDKFLSLS